MGKKLTYNAFIHMLVLLNIYTEIPPAQHMYYFSLKNFF